MKRGEMWEIEQENPRTTAKDFIRYWQQSSTTAEVARKARCTTNAVRVRACRYRKMGVPLKEFPSIEPELLDWDELAEYAESLGSGQEDRPTTAETVS
jgi:hypothetical protein